MCTWKFSVILPRKTLQNLKGVMLPLGVLSIMKLFHLSDLHLGRRLNDYSLMEDQEYILNEILKAADVENPDGVIIAGDVYDKTTPSEDAVRLFDFFLSELAARVSKIFVISGNHDSAERVAFGGRIMNRAGVFISPVYDGKIKGIPLGEDSEVYLMPFLREYAVRAIFPEKEINSITDAARAVMENIALDKSKINILAAHQFVTGSADGLDVERGSDQTRAVGGVDNISAEVFKDFDYVALGHIHKPQRAGSDNVRYCGSPMKYSFDEVNQRKSITVVEICDKGNIKTREIPLVPMRELRVFEGDFAALMAMKDCDDYAKIILTETGILDARLKLSRKFSRIAEIEFRAENNETSNSGKGIREMGTKTPADIIKEFFAQQNGSDMTAEQAAVCDEILANVLKEAE